MILLIKAAIVISGAMIYMLASIMFVSRELEYLLVCPILFKNVSIFVECDSSLLNCIVIRMGTMILRNVL